MGVGLTRVGDFPQSGIEVLTTLRGSIIMVSVKRNGQLFFYFCLQMDRPVRGLSVSLHKESQNEPADLFVDKRENDHAYHHQEDQSKEHHCPLRYCYWMQI